MEWLKLCQNCSKGCCCNKEPIFVSETDQERIKSATGKENFIEDSYFMKRENGKCIFYNKDGTCQINDVKPLDCSLYPVVFEIDGGLRFYVDLNCPNVLNLDKKWIEQMEERTKAEIKKWSKGELFFYEKHCYSPR